MSNDDHVALLTDPERWNNWRRDHRDIVPDLSNAVLTEGDYRGFDLSGTRLFGAQLAFSDLRNARLNFANLRGANLWSASLSGATLIGTDLSGADLEEANLAGADLRDALLIQGDLFGAYLDGAHLAGAILERANLVHARLRDANLSRTDLRDADLTRADLSNADLTYAVMTGANLQRSNLSGCAVYGASAWNVDLRDAVQVDLLITAQNEPTIKVDHLEVAQFIYLLLHNERIRDVIQATSERVILILGNFSHERKTILDAISRRLRELGFIPVIFDFERPTARNLIETMSTVAHLSQFVIADITEPRMVPEEIEAITSRLTIPIQPLLEQSHRPYEKFAQHKDYPGMLPLVHYDEGNAEDLLSDLGESIIIRAQQLARELDVRRALGA